MSTSKTCSRWSGTAEVVPNKGNTLLGGASGAYVSVVGLAPNETVFRALVERAMNALEFDLICLEDVTQLASNLDTASFDPVLSDRLSELRDDNPLEVGSFHAFSD